MRVKALILTSLVALAACAATIDTAHIARMDSFIGKPERELIYAWGTPDKSYALDGKTKVVSYARGTQRIIRDHASFSTCAGGLSPSFGYTNCFGGFPSAETVTYYCEYSFQVERGRITGWFQNGNDCPRVK
jgi:hypothetical protein